MSTIAGVRVALEARFLADTASTTLAADSTTSLLQLSAGAAVGWKSDELAYLTGTGATAANNRKVVRITSVDLVLHRLGIGPAGASITVAPLVGNFLRRGITHWVQSGTLIRYAKPAFSSPVKGLIEATQAEGAILYGFRDGERLRFDVGLGVWEIRAIATRQDWAEGLMARAVALLDHQPLTVAGAYVARVRINLIESREREDELYELVAIADVQKAAVAA